MQPSTTVPSSDMPCSMRYRILFTHVVPDFGSDTISTSESATLICLKAYNKNFHQLRALFRRQERKYKASQKLASADSSRKKKGTGRPFTRLPVGIGPVVRSALVVAHRIGSVSWQLAAQASGRKTSVPAI